jgi:hypothetical protein
MKNFILIPAQNIKLPLSDDIVFPISISGGAKSVTDFESGSNMTRSKELEIVGSEIVNDFFRQVLDFGDGDLTTQYLPTSKIKAVLFLNYEERLSGVLLLKNTIKQGAFTTYSVQIFNETIDFLTRADKVMISQIDTSDLAHIYKLTNIQDTWNLSKEYYYGLVDKGFDRVNQRELSIRSFGFYFKMKNLLRRIFKEFGVQYSSIFFDTDTTFQNVLIGYGGGDDINVSSGTLTNSIVDLSFGKSYDIPIAPLDIIFVTNNSLAFNVELYSSDSAPTIVSDVGGQVSGSTININYSGVSQVELIGSVVLTVDQALDDTGSTNNNTLFLNFKIGSQMVTLQATPTTVASSTITYNINQTIDIPNVNNGDLAFIGFVFPILKLTFTGTRSTSVSITTLFTYKLQNISTQLEEGTTVNPSIYLPEMTCAELFKGFVKAFAIEMETIDGVLHFEPFETFYKNRTQAIDMTAKMDREQPITLEVIQNEQPKSITFDLADNKDFEYIRYQNGIGKNYGAKHISQSSFFAVDSVDIKLPFASVESFKYSDKTGYSDLTIPRLMKVKDGGTYEPQLGRARICYPRIEAVNVTKRCDIKGTLGGLTPLYTYGTISEITPQYSLLWENPAVSFADFAFPNRTLFSQFHESRLNGYISNEARGFNAYFRLNDFELKTFTRRKLWKIDGSFFRVVSIPDADPSTNAVSKVELIKMTTPSVPRQLVMGTILPSPFNPSPNIVINEGVEGDTIVISGGLLYVNGRDLFKIIR